MMSGRAWRPSWGTLALVTLACGGGVAGGRGGERLAAPDTSPANPDGQRTDKLPGEPMMAEGGVSTGALPRPSEPSERRPEAAKKGTAASESEPPTQSAPAPQVSGDAEHHAHGYAKSFADAQRFARTFDDPTRDAWQKPQEIVSALRVVPGMRVVDLGAGTGYFEPHLAKAVGPGGVVVALDSEPAMVEYLRARAQRESWRNVEVRQVPTDEPQLTATRPDRILIVDTWHHVGDRVMYARRLWDALGPEGALVIVDYKRTSPKGPPRKWRLDAEQVIAELKRAGFDAQTEPSSLRYQYVIRAKKAR